MHKDRIQAKFKEIKHSTIEKFDLLQMQLEKMDDETREVIMLRFYSQMSFKEIAEMKGEPIGTVLLRLHRGLKKLRELMDG